MEKQILPAVAAAIFNDKGEVLLQKRKDVNKWCVISGHVEFGETIEEAIVREIQEETGTKADIVRFIGVYSSPAHQTYHYTHRTVQYVTSYFEVRIAGDIPANFCNNETMELKFFHPQHIPAEMAQINPDWLTDALGRDQRISIR